MNRNDHSLSDALIDEALVMEFQAGNPAVFDRLVMRHRDNIYNLCYWLLGNYQEADEAAQDTFLKAYGGLNTFRRQASFSTWLHRIAVNTCKNRLGSLAFRFKKRSFSFTSGRLSENELQDRSPTPLEAMEQKQAAEALAKALAHLPKDKRIVLVLREIEGFSYEEIAALTGLALGTVKSKLARARADLAKRLIKE